MAKPQTLSSFLFHPFHTPEDMSKNMEFANKYRTFVSQNKIRLIAITEIEEAFYFHFQVPSESNDGKYNYDVVLRFYTDNPELKKTSSLRGYYVQFFSNCPSFMYQYAYIYKREGFLIEALYNKLDADYIDIPPKDENKANKKSYDKSIYYVCRYLNDKKFSLLEKRGINDLKKVTNDQFFRNISDFRAVKMDQYILNEEKKLAKTLQKDKEKTGGLLGKIVPKELRDKVMPKSINRVKSGGRVAKKKAGKSTRR